MHLYKILETILFEEKKSILGGQKTLKMLKSFFSVLIEFKKKKNEFKMKNLCGIFIGGRGTGIWKRI